MLKPPICYGWMLHCGAISGWVDGVGWITRYKKLFVGLSVSYFLTFRRRDLRNFESNTFEAMYVVYSGSVPWHHLKAPRSCLCK